MKIPVSRYGRGLIILDGPHLTNLEFLVLIFGLNLDEEYDFCLWLDGSPLMVGLVGVQFQEQRYLISQGPFTGALTSMVVVVGVCPGRPWLLS